MYIGRWLYNAVSRPIRSMRKMLTSIYTAFAVTFITLAFFLMTIETVSWKWSAFTALIGFSSLIMAVIRAYKEDKESKTSRDRLEKALLELIKEIRIDRESRRGN